MPIIHARNAKISYVAEGAGEPVLLLHSSACSASQWRSLIATLSDRFRVIAPDLTGYGGSSPWQNLGTLRLADEAERVRGVLAAELGADYEGPLHLVGHSYGGAVALHLARQGLDRAQISSLVLIEPVAFHLLWNSDPSAYRTFGEVRRLADEISLSLAVGNSDRAMSRFVDYWNGEGTWARLEPRQQDALIRVADKVPQDFVAAIAEPASIGDLAGIEIPTRLICGGRSPAPTRRIFEMLAGAIPSSSGVVLKGAGHMAPLTHAAAVNAEVARHIDSHRSVERTPIHRVAA